MAPPGRKKFWQEGIEFWQDEVVGPPLKNDPDTPMLGTSRTLFRHWNNNDGTKDPY